MKLAEALVERADIQKRIEQLKVRINNNVKIQEGDELPEQPTELFKELARLVAVLEKFVQAINYTNSHTQFDGTASIADAIAHRDMLKLEQAVYRTAIDTSSINQNTHRYMRSEVKWKSTVNVIELQNKADELAKLYRNLDTKIQQMNWQIDLIER